MAEEKIVIGKVHDISFRAQHAGLSNPAVIIVGEVVSLHPSFLANSIAAISVPSLSAIQSTTD
jgi:uroporphyrin-III C-methyltransferase